MVFIKWNFILYLLQYIINHFKFKHEWNKGFVDHSALPCLVDLKREWHFIHFCYFSNSLAFVSGWFMCLLMSILFCLFWTYIWNIQWRWSLYICVLCSLLSCDRSSMCKKCWLCLCTSLHLCWWLGMLLDYELFFLSTSALCCVHYKHFLWIWHFTFLISSTVCKMMDDVFQHLTVNTNLSFTSCQMGWYILLLSQLIYSVWLHVGLSCHSVINY